MKKWRAIWIAQRREDQAAIRKVTVEYIAEDIIGAEIIARAENQSDFLYGMQLDELVEMA